MNLTEPILRHARMQPQAPALIEGERITSYAELADLVLRTATHLAALGVRAGDQVGLCLKDDSAHITALLAVLRLGAFAVQIDWRAPPAEKTRVANAFAPKLILIHSQFDMNARCPGVPLDTEWHKTVARLRPADTPAQDWHAPAVVQASSGSTGLPKFTSVTHLQLYLHIAMYLEIVPSVRRQRFLLTLPHFFSAARLASLAHLVRGDTVIIYPSFFTAMEFVQIAAQTRATAGFVAPSIVRQVLPIAEPGKPLFPQMDVLICGGAPLFAEEKLEALHKLTPKFHEMYGAAAIGPMAVLRPEDIAEYPASVGRPFSLIDMEVVDERDQPLAADMPGRLRCRGPGITTPIGDGYGPEDFRNGWYYPGEVAALDQRGYIFLQGRSSEVIFRGGAKVFPSEIEALLCAHEAVAEAAVVGRVRTDPEHELVAYIIARRPVSPGELLAYCRAGLTAYKVPREVIIVESLPHNASGKIDKLALQSDLADAALTPSRVRRK
jgi:acyl-CoA synthetase (AMP-forming)/AMP-acid ligase II